MNSAKYIGQGLVEGLANKPRAKGLKGEAKACYEKGYKEGQESRVKSQEVELVIGKN